MIHLKQIFYRDIPDDIDEDWDHGTVIGLSDEYDYKIARAYKEAGDVLLDDAIEYHEVSDFDLVGFPILYNYRHALELYLKVIVAPDDKNHKLEVLFDKFVLEYESACKQQLQVSIEQRFREFITVDPFSTAFRYEKTKKGDEYNIKGLLWVEFEPLRQFIETICSKFEQLLEVKGVIKKSA